MIIELFPKETFLQVDVLGRMSTSELRLMIRRVLIRCAEEKKNRVLMDWRDLQTFLETMDHFTFGRLLAEEHKAHVTAGNPAVSFALVGSDHMIHPNKLGEQVAKSQGVSVHVTSDLAEALAWLHAAP